MTSAILILGYFSLQCSRKVEVDGTGAAHLTDKDGRDMSMRATGDLYSAKLINTGGRQLHCCQETSNECIKLVRL